ncbi:MAG: ABC transporter permease [Acidobacteria bacterium]|nr:ABC transporter permease [Acidobacteriota bacterium]
MSSSTASRRTSKRSAAALLESAVAATRNDPLFMNSVSSKSTKSWLEQRLMGAESALELLGGVSSFAWAAIRESVRRPFEFTETLRQIFEIGWRSAPLILLSGLAVGGVLSMHTRATLERFGAESMIPTALAFALVKETGPLVTGLLVSGRVGAGIGAELGGMRVTEQIDALESLAVNSFHYLAVTRIIACVIGLPLLTVLMNFAGLLGSYFAESIVSATSFSLYFTTAFSSMVFGFIIGTTSSYLGYNATGGAEGVGRASTQSVVLSSIFLIVINVILVKFIAFLFPVGGA